MPIKRTVSFSLNHLLFLKNPYLLSRNFGSRVEVTVAVVSVVVFVIIKGGVEAEAVSLGVAAEWFMVFAICCVAKNCVEVVAVESG